MKKTASIIAGILAATLLLGGCTPKVENQPTEPSTESTTAPTESQTPSEPPAPALFADPDQLPRIDGSTACLPLMAQVIARTCGLSQEDAEIYASASKTNESWINLMEGYSDLLLVYEMPEAATEYWRTNPVELDMTAIGRDALVFLVNEDNPVKSLTQQQLIDIYTGKITNWSQIGGEDTEIIPFQRDPSSGSQTLFKKLLMKGAEPMEAPTEYAVGAMGDLVDSIASYNNSANALGYSVYYYISEMKNEPGLRLLAVDGIEPTPETISMNRYPLTNEFFAAIRADETEDSPTRTLYNWVCSEDGRQTLIDAGYVPAN